MVLTRADRHDMKPFDSYPVCAGSKNGWRAT